MHPKWYRAVPRAGRGLRSLHPLHGRHDRVAERRGLSGDIPLEYYKDPAKSAETFITLGEVRYSMPGDYATVEADGSLTLLGRGSVSINSGGEKIYPEEVEAAVKSHPDVFDAVVVGVPDERFGSRVAAVIEPRQGCQPELAASQPHCRSRIAGYKIPRELHRVAQMGRSPRGMQASRRAGSVGLGGGAGPGRG